MSQCTVKWAKHAHGLSYNVEWLCTPLISGRSNIKHWRSAQLLALLEQSFQAGTALVIYMPTVCWDMAVLLSKLQQYDPLLLSQSGLLQLRWNTRTHCQACMGQSSVISMTVFVLLRNTSSSWHDGLNLISNLSGQIQNLDLTLNLIWIWN